MASVQAMARKGITNSERGTSQCDQLWLLTYGLGLEAGARPRPFILGDLWHVGMDEFYRLSTGDGISASAVTHARAAIAKRGEELLAEAERMNFTPEHFDPTSAEQWDGVVMDPADIIADAHRAAWMVVHYWKTYRGKLPAGSFQVVMNEQLLATRVRNPATGRKSPVTTYAGRVDKLVRINGRLWVVEHKTSSGALSDWLANNATSPQVLSYAWAIEEQLGEPVAGAIYDLAYTGKQTLPQPTKDGSRLRKSAGLPSCTAAEFANAVASIHCPDWQRGGGSAEDMVAAAIGQAKKPEDVQWYADTLRALQHREDDGYWFRREVVPFAAGEVQRMGAELYHSCTRLRRMHDVVEPYAAAMRENVANGDTVASSVEFALRCITEDHPGQFVRNHSACIGRFGRMCSRAALCRSHHANDAQHVRVKAARHTELEEAEQPIG